MAVGITPPILQIVGYQNSGKTTVVSTMIQFASEHGYRLGSIKHHGHGGTPDQTHKDKDSHRHFEAGAVMSAVEGEGVLNITARKESWQLEEFLPFYQVMNVDGILVEGYKKAAYPKIVMIREQEDLVLLDDLTEIVAVIHDPSIPKSDLLTQSFLFEEKELYCLWFLDFLRR